MPRGDKSAYTDKQKRKAEHIEESYEGRGVSHEEAERRAWATVNRESGGGKKSGSGRGHPENHESASEPPLQRRRPRRASATSKARIPNRGREGRPPRDPFLRADGDEAMQSPCTSIVPRRRLPLIFRHADARL